MNSKLPGFQRYQLSFTAHIRDPLSHPRPDGVIAEGMAVYEEIVFNNLFESVSACFPVAQQMLGKRLWTKLIRAFLREHSADSPMFRKIPEEFLSFLEHTDNDTHLLLPPYLTELCHYEWIELLVATLPDDKDAGGPINPVGDLITQIPIFTPAMRLLNYDYAVHKLSRRSKIHEKSSTQLLVYRNHADNVKFMELNPVTYRLIDILNRNQNVTGKQALTLIADELNHPAPEKIIAFGKEILEALKSQDVILGSKISN